MSWGNYIPGGIFRLEAEEAMTASAPSKGDTVKVEFEATYSHLAMTDGKPMVKADGKETWLPRDAKVTVVKRFVPPPPPEPALGSVIEFPDGSVFARWSPLPYGWVNLSKTGSGGTADWRQAVERHGRSWVPWGKSGWSYTLGGVGSYAIHVA